MTTSQGKRLTYCNRISHIFPTSNANSGTTRCNISSSNWPAPVFHVTSSRVSHPAHCMFFQNLFHSQIICFLFELGLYYFKVVFILRTYSPHHRELKLVLYDHIHKLHFSIILCLHVKIPLSLDLSILLCLDFKILLYLDSKNLLVRSPSTEP